MTANTNGHKHGTDACPTYRLLRLVNYLMPPLPATGQPLLDQLLEVKRCQDMTEHAATLRMAVLVEQRHPGYVAALVLASVAEQEGAMSAAELAEHDQLQAGTLDDLDGWIAAHPLPRMEGEGR